MDIFKKVAAANGVSAEEVSKEISKAIDLAFKNADGKEKINLEEIPCDGDKPTPEELIAYIINRINEI